MCRPARGRGPDGGSRRPGAAARGGPRACPANSAAVRDATSRPVSLGGVTRTICVVGTSYVGLSVAVLLAEHHDVVAYDIDERRIELLRDRRSPIVGPRHRGAAGLARPAAAGHHRQARGVCRCRVRRRRHADELRRADQLLRHEQRRAGGRRRRGGQPGRHGRHQVDGPGRLHRGPAPAARLARTSCSRRSSCARAGRCTTTCTRRGSSSATGAARASGSPTCSPRRRSTTTCPCCSPTAPRPRRSSCSPTPTSRCGSRTSTSSTPTPRPTASTPARSSRASASTRGSGRTTTTRRSATAATACPRTPSSCSPTTPTCRRP